MKKHSWFVLVLFTLLAAGCTIQDNRDKGPFERAFNGEYTGDYLNRIAFPIGGMSAGMFTVEGTGAFPHFSLRHAPNIFNTPFIFAALSVKGVDHGAKIVEGPVQSWKVFGRPHTGNGYGPFGVPRFEEAVFSSEFPFATVRLNDADIPLEVSLTGWSPFIPLDPDNSSLPVGGLEYTFTNTSGKKLEAVFSFHSENFMGIPQRSTWTDAKGDTIRKAENGFIVAQSAIEGREHIQGDFAIIADDENTLVDYSWFRGEWSDPRTVLWNNIRDGKMPSSPVAEKAEGASLYVPVTLEPNQSKTINILMSWYVPNSTMNINTFPYPDTEDNYPATYEPWYSGKFNNIFELTDYWRMHYDNLRSQSELFAKTFYASDLPDEVIEAVAANLTILKSPTVLRQKDGRIWGWEGCGDYQGSCPGTSTHVWNYAQSVARLFPSLERSFRETEFIENQNDEGHQNFRAFLPIREISDFGHSWHASADGQLGSIIDDDAKELSHLNSVYRCNLKHDLSDFANPQRSTYAYGKEGGLLLCTWPFGGKPTLPFVYSNEVWTGIEYQVASHLMMMGEVEKGLDIVREVRKRYNGKRRNPFNEYECGHWYARAMASYALIQGLTGVFYDKVEQTMYIDSQIGESFKSFFSTDGGYGLVGLKNGEPFVDVVSGEIPVSRYVVSGEEIEVR